MERISEQYNEDGTLYKDLRLDKMNKRQSWKTIKHLQCLVYSF